MVRLHRRCATQQGGVMAKTRKRRPSSLFGEQAPQQTIELKTPPGTQTVPQVDRRLGPYAAFYRALGELREEFHRIGRFDDANAKLEELCKLLVLSVLDRRHPPPNGGSRLTEDHLRHRAKQVAGDPRALAKAIHSVYDELVAAFPEEFAAFGARTALALEPNDDTFALALVPLLSSLPAGSDDDDHHWSFDGINEAFGHFIQNSFRNRKEDAQYMTPPEVVTPIVKIALHDLADQTADDRPLSIADPTCGVGSFLAAAYRVALSIETSTGRLADRLQLIGQDKVDRMVRLANVNLRIFACTHATVRAGNSILPPQGLDDLTDSIDLIVTNPPFGAEFGSDRILTESSPAQQPVLHTLAKSRKLPTVLNSEYILLDREITLLRPGGRLLMVVPDHVVSGMGFAAHFRKTIQRFAHLEAVFDLPTETFAQAGTRTKTSVVYLRRKSNGSTKKHYVLMATADDLGFRVKSRTGATVKVIVGQNDMEQIVTIVEGLRGRGKPTADIECLSDRPSIALVADAELLGDRWNAGFYRTQRLQALQAIKGLEDRDFHGAPLDSLVVVDPSDGIRALAHDGFICISVLHVREDGSIDLKAARQYSPTTPCVRCRPGDVLMSRINPRIMRVCVVPQLNENIACSAEFAILRPREEAQLSASAIALLLRSELVQAQVRTLTSGTSSSHNRIKPRDLQDVRVPMPTSAEHTDELRATAEIYEAAQRRYYDAILAITECDRRTASFLLSD
jgi:predicted RNA methylase